MDIYLTQENHVLITEIKTVYFTNQSIWKLL